MCFRFFSLQVKELNDAQSVTSEIDCISAVFEFNALKSLTQRFMVMTDGLFGSLTEWQRKIRVRFLPIVIWAHCIHP